VDETAECVALTEPFLLLPVLDEPVAAVLKPDWVAVADEEPADEFPEDNDEVEDAVEDAEDEEDEELEVELAEQVKSYRGVVFDSEDDTPKLGTPVVAAGSASVYQYVFTLPKSISHPTTSQ